MFIEVIKQSTPLPDGNTLETIGYGVLLNVNGQEVPVPIEDLTNVELDEEDMEKAKVLYATHNDQDYQFPLPPKESRDWTILEEMLLVP